MAETPDRDGYGARVRRYETDISDEAWRLLQAMLPADRGGGRPRSTPLRAVVDAIFTVLKTGCQWRLLPAGFPAWSTVYTYFQRWQRSEVWHTIHDFLRGVVRVQAGRNPEPTVGIIDSRSVKTSAQALDGVGYDGGKKIKGRKQHVLVDSQGMLLAVKVHAAGIQDRDGAGLVFETAKGLYDLLSVVYAEAGYQGPRAAATAPVDLAIIRRTEPGFVVLPKRWIVERTFAWLSQQRRLAKDYEGYAHTVETFIRLAMIRLMLQRILP